MNEQTHLVFRALTSPIRREIITIIRTSDGYSAVDFAAAFDMTRGAVSKHLLVLESAGVVSSVKVGRRRTWTLDKTALSWVISWAELNEVDWLDALNLELGSDLHSEAKNHTIGE